MPFSVEVDHLLALVRSTWEGSADEKALFAYVDQVWTDPRVRGYNELIDFRRVTGVDVRTDTIGDIARYSREFDNPDEPAKSAIVAPQALIFGLSRMFTSMRELEPDDRREFRVFDDYEAACTWLARS